MGAFWSVAAFTDLTILAPTNGEKKTGNQDSQNPLDSPGIVKGFLLRHLRYWAAKPGIFHADGTLNIGYAFPNAYMCEDYNSPQSVYWCLKTLICIGLPPSHSFWTCEELPHPLYAPSTNMEVTSIKPPLQIVCNGRDHTFLLSSGQFCGWPLKATEAKYSKFAYSSAFAFSVPTGPLIQQIAPDSTLALSLDDGDTWKVRWKSSDAKIEYEHQMSHGGREVPYLVSRWKPWKLNDITVVTKLSPPTEQRPDWHVRTHIIRVPSSEKHRITAMEGGFAIFGRQKESGLHLPDIDLTKDEIQKERYTEGKHERQGAAFVISRAGASGIRDLGVNITAKGVVLRPDSNTNLLEQRTLIPMLQSTICTGGEPGSSAFYEYKLRTGVFALAAENGELRIGLDELTRRWNDPPR